MSIKSCRYLAVLVAVSLIVLVAGCGGGGEVSPPDGQQKTTTFTYAVGTDAQTLDPHFVTDVPTAVAVTQIHDTLVARNADMEFVPALATEWSTSEDGRTWTFRLREGVKFHDGADFNAEAVKYNFERILDPEIGSPRRSMIEMVEKVEVVDEYTVAITTKTPFGPFLAQISSYNLGMLSPKTARERGKGYAQNPAGTGPFKLKAWEPGDTLIFEANQDYWGGKPAIDELVFRVVPEDSTRIMLLKSGDVDAIAGVPAFEVETLKGDQNVVLISLPGFRTIYVGMNCQQKPFDDPRVRQAVNYAIDRQAIVDHLLRGVATVGVGPESTSIPGSVKDLPPYGRDVEKAKALLAEAGYPDGFSTVMHSPSGRYPMDQQVAEAVVGQLAEVGIKADLQVLEFGAYQDMLNAGKESRLFLLGKGSPTGDPDMTLTLSFGTGGGMNNALYSNSEVDELLVRQREAVDPVERQALLREIQELIHADAPWAVLYYEQIMIGTRKNVSGLTVLPNELVIFSKVAKGQ